MDVDSSLLCITDVTLHIIHMRGFILDSDTNLNDNYILTDNK